ncbi:MAG: N-acetylmuramic acid 6-phosphate etherase [Calditrichaeota bacterium]|nr:MAG: N-acetylmuramic acid 6-phosphate etherase [Calditrichota bacterium]MBL1205462.1 N-acetylmuramic acid 6-phosphate etherase [Calditrichota bacterium]NOG45291.1 N-acetylmuramic acid 6-phosphate etherase [Calditrichota bacterium]
MFNELSALVTESRNTNSSNIDELNTQEILNVMNSEDHKVPEAIKNEIPFISEAVDIVTYAFKNGGRLVYAGAGTSGRLGVLDASECPPTFGVPKDMVIGLIAGGYEALHQAVEGYEDYEENGAKDVSSVNLTEKDVLCGIAASKRTPYVLGAIKEAKKRGAKTLAVVCNPREHLQFDVDVAICPVPGPEVVMGSTRLKAGSSQKMVLNMITTASMIKLGKVYENMMIDLQQNNLKLVERSKKIIMLAADVDYNQAAKFLDMANGHVKTAIFLSLTDVTPKDAEKYLSQNNGFLKKAIKDWQVNSK